MPMYPPLPDELKDHGMFSASLEELWTSLIIELMNQKLLGRNHYNRRTYDSGCSGPMCRKAVREHARRAKSTSTSERYLFIDPILMYWYPIAQKMIADEHSKTLLRLTTAEFAEADSLV